MQKMIKIKRRVGEEENDRANVKFYIKEFGHPEHQISNPLLHGA